MTRSINLKSIRIDGGTQSRVDIDNDVVSDYAEAIKAGTVFPPVVVFNDGAAHWLADGFHRFHAHGQAGKASIPADVRTGTVRDAILHSLGANVAHGLRRSNADKRKAVLTVLADPEWAAWTDRKVAEACGVTHPFVAGLRRPKVVTVTTPPTTDAPETTAGGSEQNPPARGNSADETSKPDSMSTAAPPASSGGERQSAPPTSTPPAASSQANPSTAGLPGGAPSASDEEDFAGDFDPIAELKEAHEELGRLRKLVEADDKSAEALKWQSAYDVAQRRSDEHLQTIASRDKQITFLSRQLMRCGKAVCEADTDKIAPAVERMARAVKVPA